MSKFENDELQKQKRKSYLNGEISHYGYYVWLADFLEIPDSIIPFSKQQLISSNDPHFNDLKLSSWDSKHSDVLIYVIKKLTGWSLSDTVCVLKTMARRLIDPDGNFHYGKLV